MRVYLFYGRMYRPSYVVVLPVHQGSGTTPPVATWTCGLVTPGRNAQGLLVAGPWRKTPGKNRTRGAVGEEIESVGAMPLLVITNNQAPVTAHVAEAGACFFTCALIAATSMFAHQGAHPTGTAGPIP